MAKAKWDRIRTTKGKMWTIETYYRAYGSTSKYAKKEVWTPTKINALGKRETKYFKTI